MKKSYSIFTGILLLNLFLSPVYASVEDFERGKKAFNARDYVLSTQYFRRALGATPANITFRYYLAQSLVQQKQLNQAQIEFQRIIQVAPYSQEARYSKIALVQVRDYINNQLHPKWRSKDSNLQVGLTETTSRADVGDNYIDKVTEKGNVIHWQTKSMPLKVYLETNPKKVALFQNSYTAAVKRGIDQWTSGSKGKISWTYVNTPEMADIKIFWRSILDPKLTGSEAGTAYTAGVTTPEYNDKELYAMSIILTTTDPNGKPHKEEDIEKVAAHEFGHALGIMGHSEVEGDLMYANSKSDGNLSKRDVNTITLLYDLEADISNFRSGRKQGKGDGSEGSDVSESRTNEVLGSKDERLKREVAEMEEALKKNPKSDINHVNLGNLYGDQGEYDKAIRTYKKAIQLNPKNEVAHSNLASMYQNTSKPYDALREYNESIRLNPNKPKPHLQVAIISEQLNQKAQSIAALREYLKLNPKAKEDAEVRNLMKRLEINSL